MNKSELQKYHNAKVQLISWRDEFLVRSGADKGVAAAPDGARDWVIESLDNGKIKLKSSRGDYLYRPNTPQGVTTGGADIGTEWRVERLDDGKIKLKSWRGDYLHRPAGGGPAVTTWSVGVGNHWGLRVIEAQPDVVISQIFYDGRVARTEADEYVEITNRGIGPANISGWTISADDVGQSYTFADDTVLRAGEVVRVYTNETHPEFGGYSYGSGRAIWNNKGDTGRLMNGSGAVVSEFPYGHKKKERTIQDVLDEQGVSGCTVVADAREVQSSKGGRVGFLDALERALVSLIEDPADGNAYTAASAVRDNWDGVPADADAATIQQIIRDHVEHQRLILLDEQSIWLGDASESIDNAWIFFLREGMGDTHYIYVDRKGKKDTYQEIS